MTTKFVGPATKGLALESEFTLEQVRTDLTNSKHEIGSGITRYPVLELSDSAMEHNISLMAAASAATGCVHAPHIKTSMSPQLVERQLQAGSWGITTATVGHISAALAWDIPALTRVFHANEVVSSQEAAFLGRKVLERFRAGKELTVYVYVDSVRGVELIASGLADCVAEPAQLSTLERAHVYENVCVIVELGVLGGRTGIRSTEQAITVATAAQQHGLNVRGVSGYEGSVAGGQTAAELQAVADYLQEIRKLGQTLINQKLVNLNDSRNSASAVNNTSTGSNTGTSVKTNAGSIILSAGGSAYLDVIMEHLPGALQAAADNENSADSSEIAVIPVVRAGAYIIHDHGLLARANPWTRMPHTWVNGQLPQAAATVHALVLSTPEPGLALLNVGRRDVPFDIDLPTVTSHTGWAVTSVNDQHAFLHAGETHTPLQPGDVVQLGISHPCTIFDKWATALVTNDDHHIINIIETQF